MTQSYRDGAMLVRHISVAAILLLFGCGDAGNAPPPKEPRPAQPKAGPCFQIHGDGELRASDAQKMIKQLVDGIQLSPQDEALRKPKSIADVKQILRRDVIYLFADAAEYAKALDTTEGRTAEAQLELLLGESQLEASQILTTQEAWLGNDLRIARANVAGKSGETTTDHGHMLSQLIAAVEEGNKVADALGIVAPRHLARASQVIRRLQKDAPEDRQTQELVADFHRLRGEWSEFDGAMKKAEASDKAGAAVCYLRGMEQLERFRNAAQATARMRDCLTKYPAFVRAQAALVLMAESATDGFRELNALKKMSQEHYLVMLLEPTLAADQELHKMQGTADATP